MKCDVDIRKDLYGNIVMVVPGGSKLMTVWWHDHVPWYRRQDAKGDYGACSFLDESQDCCSP
jgi:hypothetical protein